MAARQPASANHTKCGSVLTPPLTCLATQGLAPSYHNSNHDTAVIIKPRNVMVFEGDFVTDMIAFAASVEQCLGIRGTDITAWLNTWWDGLSLAFKKTGRAVQVSSLLLTAAPRISLLLLTTVAYCGCCSLMLTAHCISLLLLTAAAHFSRICIPNPAANHGTGQCCHLVPDRVPGAPSGRLWHRREAC